MESFTMWRLQLSDGELLGLVPKRYLPAYSEFYEMKETSQPGKEEITRVMVDGKEIPFGQQDPFFLSGGPEELIRGSRAL